MLSAVTLVVCSTKSVACPASLLAMAEWLKTLLMRLDVRSLWVCFLLNKPQFPETGLFGYLTAIVWANAKLDDFPFVAGSQILMVCATLWSCLYFGVTCIVLVERCVANNEHQQYLDQKSQPDPKPIVEAISKEIPPIKQLL